ncbi:MAG: hypothetical protein WAW00_03515 [Candidatus Moraniibacteriota bacterium]
MKYIRKIAASSLIVALAFFAGSSCLHPMPAQAMGNVPMAMPASPVGGADDAVSGGDSTITLWNLCIVNCVSEMPRAVASKKFSVDFSADILSGIPDDGDSRLFAFSSGATDLTGTHPPASDSLFSVFKKE